MASSETRSTKPGSDNYWPPMPETCIKATDNKGQRWEVFFPAPKNADELLTQIAIAEKHMAPKKTFAQRMEKK